MNSTQYDPYPVEALPPMLRNLVQEIHANAQAPIELCAPLALGMASLVCQNSIDVRRPNCPPSSCSLYVLVIAGSGEGKSTVSNILAEPVREFEQHKQKQNEQHLVEFETNQIAWNAEQKVLLATFEKLKKKDECTEDVKARLTRLLGTKPKAPKSPKLLYNDVTPEAVVYGLCEDWPSAAIVSDEGGSFFNGRSSQNFPTWNRVWDGRGLNVDRRGASALSHRAPRCTILASIQDAPFRRFYHRQGPEALESGFLPRFLVAYPTPTRGTRFLGNMPTSCRSIEKYNERVKEILEEDVIRHENGFADRLVLEFSPAARDRWVQIYNEIESAAAPNQYLSDIQGYAAKVADNIARISAVFHFFEGNTGEISFETVERAEAICQWHTFEFKRLFAPKPNISIQEADAKVLQRWLTDFVWRHGRSTINKNYILQRGPNVLRTKARLDDAINFLNFEGKIWTGFDNRMAKTINLSAIHFNSPL